MGLGSSRAKNFRLASIEKLKFKNRFAIKSDIYSYLTVGYLNTKQPIF